MCYTNGVTETDRREWIVLFAHGSADSRWRAPLVTLRDQLTASDPGRGVALAYLQFCEPTLHQALRACRDAGATRALVVPVFMSGGGHLLRDVPATIAAAAEEVPGLSVRSSGALAEEPEVIEAMCRACLRLTESQ
jgi:sirohydrochlorin cobaltochelatase